jgi:hypothetical protein
MKMSKHTPGPWVAEERSEIGEGYWHVICPDDGIHCQVMFEGTEADSRLIAAAPDLLELAEALLLIGNREENGIAHGVNPTEFAATLAPMARAAIAKAKEE